MRLNKLTRVKDQAYVTGELGLPARELSPLLQVKGSNFAYSSLSLQCPFKIQMGHYTAPSGPIVVQSLLDFGFSWTFYLVYMYMLGVR